MNGKSLARTILMIVTALVILVYYVPLGHVDYLNNWRDGTYGFSVDQRSLVIYEVDSPQLIKDGVHPGDRVLLGLSSIEYSHSQFPRAGERMVLRFQTTRGILTEHLTAYPSVSFDLLSRLGGIAAIVPSTVFLIVAFMLVFVSPSVMTWMFYLFAVGYFATKASIGYYDFLPLAMYKSMMFVLSTLFGNFAAVPLVQFMLRFPDNDVSGGWRKRVNSLVWIYTLGAYALYVYDWYDLNTTGSGVLWLAGALNFGIPLSSFAISALILVKKFKLAGPEVRQRMVWLILGLIISFAAYAVYFIPNIPAIGFVPPFSDNARQIVGFAVILMPLSVAYAVFQYRVIDVNFVINRAIVYAALTIMLAAAVSLLDWLAGRLLGGAHLATGVEALVTIGLGFALNRLHQTFEGWVDRFLFWRRHRAEQYIKRVAAALPFATADLAITDGLVYEPVEALDLAGAALYRRAEDSGDFDFVAAWRASPMSGKFEANDNLVRFLLAEEKVLWLSELGTRTEDRTGVFVIAVPILVRHQVIAFTLYASHRNGSQIDPDEVRILADLAVEAARAYDHVEAVRTRERMEEMRIRLERLEGAPQLG